MSPRTVTLAASLVLLLAGCATDPAAPPEPSPDSSPAPAPPGLDAAEAAIEAAPAPHATPAANRSIPIEVVGSTEWEHCPGAVTREVCIIVDPAEGTPFELPVVDRPTLLALTITIDEPSHEPGCTYALLRVKDGDQWRLVEVAIGASPLTVAWGLATHPPGSAFQLSVYCGKDTHVNQGTLMLYNGWRAPFRIEGSLHHETA